MDLFLRKGKNPSISLDDRTIKKFAYSGNNVEYIGTAAPGSTPDDAVWSIQKLTYDGDNVTDVKWANGNVDFKHVWAIRTTYTYS